MKPELYILGISRSSPKGSSESAISLPNSKVKTSKGLQEKLHPRLASHKQSLIYDIYIYIIGNILPLLYV